MFCPKCGTQCENTSVCPACGTSLDETIGGMHNSGFAPVVEVNTPTKTKKPPKGKVALAIVAVILVLAIVLSSVAIAITSDPMVKLSSAVEKLLFDTKSFNFEYVEKYSSETHDKMTGERHERSSKIRIKGSISLGSDLFSSSFNVKASDEDETYLRAVSDGGDTLFVVYPSEDDNPGIKGNLPQIYKYIKDNREEIVDTVTYSEYSYDEVEELVEENAFISIDQILEWIEEIVSKKNLNEDTIEEIYDSWIRKLISEYGEDIEVDELPEYKTIKKVLIKFVTKGITEEAVEIADKRREDGVQYYDMVVHGEEFMQCLYDFLEESKDLEDFFKTDLGDNMLESLEDSIGYIDSGDKLEFTLGVSKGRLSYIGYEDSYVSDSEYYKHSSKEEVEIILSDFNKKVDYKQEYADVKKLRDEEDWVEISELDDVYSLF